MIDAILFNPALTFTGAIGGAAIIWQLTAGRRPRMRTIWSLMVLAPISPLLLVRTAASLIMDGCDRIADRIPGSGARIRAARYLAGEEMPGNVVPFTRTRKR